MTAQPRCSTGTAAASTGRSSTLCDMPASDASSAVPPNARRTCGSAERSRLPCTRLLSGCATRRPPLSTTYAMLVGPSRMFEITSPTNLRLTSATRTGPPESWLTASDTYGSVPPRKLTSPDVSCGGACTLETRVGRPVPPAYCRVANEARECETSRARQRRSSRAR